MKKVRFEEVYANKYIQESVKNVVGQVVKTNPALSLYADDMEQELWIHINRSVKRYSSNKGTSIESFFRGVIDRRIKNVKKMFFSKIDPINISKEELDSEDALQFAGRNDHRLMMMKMDVATVMEQLSPQQRQICNWIMEGDTHADIARRLGIPESKFYYRYIYPLRQIFKDKNLDNYLE